MPCLRDTACGSRHGRRVDPYQADWASRRYRVIQAPGPNNAMGRVKFLFPNVHNVYIHDTPHRELFANAQRDDSSGCVRVEHPEELAIWILSAEGWSAQAVREAFDSGDTRRIRLRHEVPVHILYSRRFPTRWAACASSMMSTTGMSA